MPFLDNSFNNLPMIRLYHGAFLALRSSCIIFWIFLGVKNLIVFVT
jgi:hypothetical protein